MLESTFVGNLSSWVSARNPEAWFDEDTNGVPVHFKLTSEAMEMVVSAPILFQVIGG